MSNLNHLTDEELLRFTRAKADASPVIKELCVRLEAKLDEVEDLEKKKTSNIVADFSCPCCEAQIVVEIDPEDNELISVKGK